MPDYNDILLGAFKPYLHSGLWLLAIMVLILLGIWLLTLAWRKREEAGGISYVFAAFAALPFVGTASIYVIKSVDLWQGVAAIVFSVLLVFGQAPRRRRRSPRY